eukprot:CAMPEP_0177302496 /NCGR_PEP_ID=MMETSP0368-20130122/5624_1 /TAXON_ID=447022 ORGANISM="Scrippsiella hangoei-like, Strain SHHI-4" /NCGR_SAMPLE_ID=MMETSP0368 /ASSEMBLY_ACC=CAM_ASM_000363 /LENGTH=45 /DNA_ID= /DNA_START= /DNA_END= /DNA_ORIENTATION=
MTMATPKSTTKHGSMVAEVLRRMACSTFQSCLASARSGMPAMWQP